MREATKAWLELCNEDMLTARVLLEKKRLVHCGYFCNQVVEKAFKAIIAENTDKLPPRIHDLQILAEESGTWNM